MLPDTPAIYPAWKTLVAATGTTGKQVHDARLAAVCAAHGAGRLLTFNATHFVRFGPHIPGFAAVAPGAAGS